MTCTRTCVPITEVELSDKERKLLEVIRHLEYGEVLVQVQHQSIARIERRESIKV